MSAALGIRGKQVFDKIKKMSNQHRFRILELTQDEEKSISELSSMLKLSYTKCADYVKILENVDLVKKTKRGREVLIKSKVNILKDKILF